MPASNIAFDKITTLSGTMLLAGAEFPWEATRDTAFSAWLVTMDVPGRTLSPRDAENICAKIANLLFERTNFVFEHEKWSRVSLSVDAPKP